MILRIDLRGDAEVQEVSSIAMIIATLVVGIAVYGFIHGCRHVKKGWIYELEARTS